MEFNINRDGETGTLFIRGSQTIAQAEELRSSLLDALNGVRELEIDLSGIDEVDLTFLQIICAAHRTSRDLDKKIILKNNWPEALSTAADSAGFFQHRRCRFDLNNDCLWYLGGR